MTRKLLLPLLALAALAALALPARADSLPRPMIAAFTHGAKLTVAGYAAGKPTLSDFPVLVRISTGSPVGFSYSDMQNANAAAWDDIDIAFVDMLGNGLPFEIDTWNPGGESLVWVGLPTMQNGTEFVMCWGSSSSGRAVCASKPWGEYAGVWHMNEPGDGPVTISDATDNHLDGLTTSGSYAQPSGMFGGARTPTKNGSQKDAQCIAVDLSAQAKRDAVDGINTEANGHSFTVSMWVKPVKYSGNGTPSSQYLVSRKYEDATPAWGIQYHYISANNVGSKDYSRIRTWGSETGKGDNDMLSFDFDNSVIPSSAASCLGNWFKYDVVYSGDAVTFYVNGGTNDLAVLSGNLIIPPPGNSEYLYLAGTPAKGKVNGVDIGTREFEGDMDEVRLRGGAMTADWVAADWSTQTDVTFLTVGTAEAYVESDAPVASMAIAPIQYTNATANVAVFSLGSNASEATLNIEFALDDAFASIVKSEEISVNGSGHYNVSATGLSYGTTYYVRGSIANNQNNEASLGPVSFTTPTPGSPAGTASLVSPGYTTLDATATVSSFGTDGESTTMWLEASTASDFSTFVSGTVVSAVVGTAAELSISGLSPETFYNLRVRIRNNWGIDTIVPIASTSTRAEPFAATGLVFSEGTGGTIDFTFPMTAVYDGATVEAVLTYDGVAAGTQTTGVPATLSWTGVAAASGTATATVVATATLPNGGGTFTKTWTVSVVPGATSTVVADVSAYASAAGALWVRPGDVAVLPELTGGATYQVLNDRFASISGNALTALEPGIVGIRCVDANFVTNVMGVVVLPDAIGGGSVYVYDETKSDGSFDWSRPACWKKVGSASNDSFPQNADDIAILPFYVKTSTQYVRHRANIAVGGLYVGMIRPDASLVCVLERYKDDPTRTVTFQRTDGEPVSVKVCPNGENNCSSTLRFGGYCIDVVWASDTIVDCCSSETDTSLCRGLVDVANTTNPGVSTNTVAATLTFQGLPGYYMSGNGCTVTMNGVWRGTGEIIKKGWGGIAFPGDFSQFEGKVYEMSGPNPGDMAATAAGVLMRAAGASNVVAHVYGWGSFSPSTGAMSYNGLSQGSLATGGSGVLPEFGAQGPAKGLYMHGGTYRASAIDKTGWGVGGKDEKAFDVLSVGAGLNYISIEGGKGNGSGKPINVVTARTLAQTDKGTLVIYDPSCNNAPSLGVTNSMFTAQAWAGHAVGATADPLASDVYPIIPWIVFNRSSDFNNVSFATFDAAGRLVKSYSVNTEIDAVRSEDSNAYVNAKSINRNSSTKPNLVMRSLFLNDSGKTRTLGAGRTLTITSGGLVLHGGGSSIGLPSGGADNGALVLGDAMHPAYVYAKSFGNDPNQIWATTTAAGGFVKSWTGNLVLGGDQTGIANEIVVNGGSLALGTDAKDCELTEGLPIRVCAGATLKLPYEGTVEKSPIKLDGSAEAFGKIELPVNQTCASLSVRDVYESDAWTALPAGTYGSSVSGAEFVRDDLFAGPGVLTVGPAAPSTDVMLLIW